MTPATPKTQAPPLATTKSALTVTLGGMLGQLITIASAALVPRLLGAHDVGLRAACFAVIALASAGVQLSLGWIDIRRLAPAWEQRHFDESLEVASTTWALRVVLSVVVGGCVSLWLFVFSGLLDSPVAAAAILVLTITQYWHQTNVSLFLPLGMARSFSILDLVQKASSTVGVIAGFVLAGLTGAFVGHACANLLLAVVSTGLLRRILPVTIRRFSLPVIRRDLRHLVWNLVSLVCYSIQTYLPVYLVAAMVSPTDAGFASIQLQAFVILNGLALLAQQAILPKIARLETEGARGRMHYWAARIFQFEIGLGGLLLVIWHVWGEALTVLLLSSQFKPAAPGVFWMIVAHMLFFSGHVCFAILNIRGRAMESAATWALYMIANVAGVLLAIHLRGDNVATSIALAYAGASALFFASAYISMGSMEHFWLPLRAVAALAILTAVFVIAVPSHFEHWGPRLLASAGALVTYIGVCVWLQLLPLQEGRVLVASLWPKSVAQ